MTSLRREAKGGWLGSPTRTPRVAVLLACVLALAAGLSSVARGSATAGPEVNVSNLPGTQNEAIIAADPSSGRVLLAGSNSLSEGTMRVYGSTDGGATWQASTVFPRPASPKASCAADPGVGIDTKGRQYFSFVRATPCSTGAPRLFVASRADAGATWGAPALVAPLATSRFDDKPAIAVDASAESPYRDRVYVGWSRLSRNGVFSILLSGSDDGGRTWSRPRKVNRTGSEESYSSIAVGRKGTVYVAWNDGTNYTVRIARSTDGGAHFEPERNVASVAVVTIPHCGSGIVIPAQRLRCVQANPIVSVDNSRGPYSGRVYVTYAGINFAGDQGASLAVFNSRLRALAGYPLTNHQLPIAPAGADRRGDQFWPQSAVDPSTGTLWVCFYDTLGDPDRRSAFYSCTASNDGGGTWTSAVHAATVASDETRPGASPGEYGDYEGLAVGNGVAHPIWTDSRNLADLSEEIYTTTLTPADFTSP